MDNIEGQRKRSFKTVNRSETLQRKTMGLENNDSDSGKAFLSKVKRSLFFDCFNPAIELETELKLKKEKDKKWESSS